MKSSNTTRPIIENVISYLSSDADQDPRRRLKTRFACLSCASILITGLFWSGSSAAVEFVPLGEGTLPSGQIVSMYQVTFDPGESFPWHFHAGQLWGIIISGTLTEDEGCGSALNVYPAGTAFAEEAGRVHRVFNFGSDPVVIRFATIMPSCRGNYQDTILVEGPECEGQSEKSHLEKVPACP